MAIQPIRRGAVGRSTYKASGDRSNGSQFRPTSPVYKRKAPPIAAPVLEGTDRFAIHAYGNTKITINGADFSVLTEYDPDYELPPFNPYLLAQKGVFVQVASDADDIDSHWQYSETGIGSGMIISDYYNEESEYEESRVKGVPLEIYNINITGPSVEVGIVALDNPPMEEYLPGPQVHLMSLDVDAPLGVSARQKFYDQSPLMLSSDQYVTVNTPTLGKCTVTPKLARKASWIKYLPAILKPPVHNGSWGRDEHTVAIVIGFNGGTPKLFKYSFESDFQSQGSSDSYNDWYYAFDELMGQINEDFYQEVLSFVEGESALPPYASQHPSLFTYQGVGMFNLTGNLENTDDSMSVVSVNFYGANEIYETEEDGFYPLTQPAYITVYPNHALIKADPSITIDLGVESTFTQNSALVPFNVHATAMLVVPRPEAE